MNWTNILAVLKHRASHTPDQRAFAFLNNKGTIVKEHSYASLALRAQQIAYQIKQHTEPKDRVILLYPPGLDFIEAFFACLYADVISVPAYPPRKNAHALRIKSLVQDARVSLALTTSSERKKLAGRENELDFLKEITCCSTNDLSEEAVMLAPQDWPQYQTDDLAFLQYTSGSTGNPKGVMVGHDNMLTNLEALHRHTHFVAGDRMVSWLPAFHDMGLIYGILLPLYVGNPSFLMAPVTFITRPLVWLQSIAKYEATHAVAPNFAFDLCADKLKAEDVASLDLSRVKYFANAAEPIREKSILRFAELLHTNPNIKEVISPAYGLAEATLVVSCADPFNPSLITCSVDQEQLSQHRVVFSATAAEASLLVGSGQIVSGVEVKLVHPDTKMLCTAKEVGEIWVKGATVAKGYWQRETLSDDIFRAYTSDTNEGPFLRTGDLGFLHQGELFITGRLKDLIIVEGVNHYPQDIEFAIQQLSPDLIVGKGAAFAVDYGRGEELVLVQEVHPRMVQRTEAKELQQWCETIQDYILQNFGLEASAVVLVKKSAVPITSSGKIRRRSCRELFLKKELPIIAQSQYTPTNLLPLRSRPELEAYLIQQLARIFKMEPALIELHQTPQDLGLDSLAAMEIRSRFQKDFNWKINTAELLYQHNIAEIIDQLYATVNDQINTLAKPALDWDTADSYQEQDVDALSEDQLDQLIALLETEV